MVFNKNDKVSNKVLLQNRVMEQKKLIKVFMNKSWSQSSLKKLRMKIDQTGTVDRKSGKKRKTRIADNIASVKELVKKMH